MQVKKIYQGNSFAINPWLMTNKIFNLFLVDWSLANFVAIRQNSIGQIRYVMKDLLKYLPFFGPYFMQVLNVLLYFYQVMFYIILFRG